MWRKQAIMENFSKLSNSQRWVNNLWWPEEKDCRDSLKLTSHVIWFNPQKRQLHMVQGLGNDPVLNAIENFSNHISVFKIVETRNIFDSVSFKSFTAKNIWRFKSYPKRWNAKIIKNNSDIFSKLFQANLTLLKQVLIITPLKQVLFRSN